MPYFFIDTDDGDFSHHDDEGWDFPNAEAARLQAIDALPDMARQKLPNGDHRVFAAHIRDERGAVLYTATLSLFGEWHVRPSDLNSK